MPFVRNTHLSYWLLLATLLFWSSTVCSAHHLNCTNETRIVYYNDTITYFNWTQSIVFNATTNETMVVNQTTPVSVLVLSERNTTYVNCTMEPDNDDAFDLFDPNNWRLLVTILFAMTLFLCLLFACVKVSKSYKNNTTKIGIHGRNQANGFVDRSGNPHMPLGTVDLDSSASSDLTEVSISGTDANNSVAHTHKHGSVSTVASAPPIQGSRPAVYSKLSSNPTAQLNLLDHPDGEKSTTTMLPSDVS